GLGPRTEHVVVRHLESLLRLDPFGAKSVLPAPFLAHATKADHLPTLLLPRESADGRPESRVHLAIPGDSARLGDGDRTLARAGLPVRRSAAGACTPRAARGRGWHSS